MSNRAEVLKKYQRLLDILKSYKSVLIAFSGGVDSTLLVYAAKEALGKQIKAATIQANWVPVREIKEAKEFCKKMDTEQIFFTVSAKEIEGFAENPPDRCYLCKKKLFMKMKELAAAEGLSCVAEGSNLDDLGDYRPGLKAIRELDIKSPLREAGLTKEDIRALSREFQLPTWNKPSFACLASRFVYGEQITAEKLAMVEAAEQIMMDAGFRQFRVRMHGMMARLEILPEEFERMLQPSIREKIYQELKKLGYTYVSLDLGGYRTGSMNENLNLNK